VTIERFMEPATINPGWDDQNLSLVDQPATIDSVNERFYGQFPFPPRAYRLERSLDPDFQRTFLCQDIGDWTRTSIPARPSIWVAGCGTNQAVITALAFPNGRVVGSDVSPSSVDLASRATSSTMSSAPALFTTTPTPPRPSSALRVRSSRTACSS
jgi:hypothetical protein